MNRIRKVLALSALASVLGTGVGYAQEHHDDRGHDNHQYVRHNEWKKGYHCARKTGIAANESTTASIICAAPPGGYEWRMVDGNYVLAAIATGVISSVIVASTIH